MKALTVRQPWAECIARGEKLIENRSQTFKYRGPIAIHAAKTASYEGYIDRRVCRLLWGSETCDHRIVTPGLDETQRGQVIAVAEIVDCHRSNGCCAPWGDDTAHHLVLDNVRRLTSPFWATGRLGLWDIDDWHISYGLGER